MLLNKLELDKRQTFQEIMSGYPSVKAQKVFLKKAKEQSIEKESPRPKSVEPQETNRSHNRKKPKNSFKARKYISSRIANVLVSMQEGSLDERKYRLGLETED